MDDANLHDEQLDVMRTRPAGPATDHTTWSRKWFETEVSRTDAAIKLIDLRMENTADEIARLRRQQAADTRELAELTQSHRAAQRAIAELDGVEL